MAVDEIRRIRGDYTIEKAREYLARFRFWGDDPLRVVSGYSGGERSRLALAKMLLEPRNLLFLDEPTNHLDIPAAEILEEALMGFEGTVLFVSHDRRFLENVATRIVSVRDGKVTVYQGGFRDFVADTQVKKAEPPAPTKRVSVAPAKPAEVVDRKKVHEAERVAAREKERAKKRIGELENGITLAETELAMLREQLKADPGGNWAKLSEMATREQALAKKVDAMMAEWAKLSEAP
jgi:ATP-binding cassette subfamily F protein 3